MNIRFCKTCGATLVQKDEYTWACNYCQNTYSDNSVRQESEKLLKTLMNDQKIEQVSNLRKNLYDAISAKYTDSEEICRICGEIKALLPDDFMANFYYIANHDTPKAICEAIRSVDAEENASYVDGIVKHIVKSMRSEYALPLQNLVERAYKNTDMQKFEDLSTLISDETEKVNAGMYETAVPRNAFIAYSSRDMDKVEELVHYLEANGLDCFVAARNLRHGRGAVQNYEKALHEALDNCECVVFVSSKNSRSMECDALGVELKYIKGMDIANTPAEYKKSYTSIPYRYKKNRVEYRIDNEQVQPFAEKVVSEFFSGLEYACSPEEVADRIYNIGTEPEDDIPETVAPPSDTSAVTVKYCTACGSENAPTAKFCVNFKANEFVNTLTEYELTKKLKDAIDDKERLREENKSELLRLANESENKHLDFTLLKDGNYSVAVADEENCPENVVIPSVYKGVEVTEAEARAFFMCKKLRSVHIPVGFAEIGEMAFALCDSLEYVYIPNSVAKIGTEAFSGCKSLKEITFGGTKGRWSDIEMSENSIPEGVKIIFKNEEYTENTTVTNKSYFLFEERGDGTYSVSPKSNEDCPAIIILPDKYKGKAVTEIADGAFEGKYDEKNTSLKSITIPEGIIRIGDNAFNYCSSLANISLPSSLTEIGKNTFSGCDSLRSINLPDSVTSIGFGAFSSCDELSDIKLPKNLKKIEDLTFYGSCLVNITVSKSVTYIGESAFGLSFKLQTITYEGTKAEWKAIKKGKSWKANSCFKVVCTDGTISKLFA